MVTEIFNYQLKWNQISRITGITKLWIEKLISILKNKILFWKFRDVNNYKIND